MDQNQIKYILSIDVGQQHMCMCAKFYNDPVFKHFLFGFHDPNKQESVCQKMNNLNLKLNQAFGVLDNYVMETYKIPKEEYQREKHIQIVLIEQQLEQARIGGGVNSCLQYALIMWFSIHNIKTVLQPASKKYNYMWDQIKISNMIEGVDDKKKSNNKQIASIFVIRNYIDHNLVQVMFQSEFGEYSSRRNANGKPRMSRIYTQQTKDFVTKYNIDKLDDIADTILMIEQFLKQINKK